MMFAMATKSRSTMKRYVALTEHSLKVHEEEPATDKPE